MTDDRPMIRLRPKPHEWAIAMQRGDALPTEVSIYTARHVCNLRAQGLTFADIPRRAPETLSPTGAFFTFRTALEHLTANTHRKPLDGRPGAPAWTPATSSLAATLRPTERNHP